MTGEWRLVRASVAWVAAGGVVASGLAWLVRGSDGAISVAIAVGMVIANALVAAGISALASRLSTFAAAMVSLPSFAIRMAAILGLLAVLKRAVFIDDPTFVLAFGLGVTAVLILEARAWKRTPWLAVNFGPKPQQVKEQA